MFMEKHMTGRTDVDRLPVVDRIPAGPRVRLKCGGPAKATGPGQKQYKLRVRHGPASAGRLSQGKKIEHKSSWESVMLLRATMGLRMEAIYNYAAFSGVEANIMAGRALVAVTCELPCSWRSI